MPRTPRDRTTRPSVQSLEGRSLMSVDLIARVTGIPGMPARHSRQIELLSYSFGASSEGGATPDTLYVGRTKDRSSALLQLAAASGQHVKKVVLTQTIGGLGRRGNQTGVVRYELENVLISSYDISSSSAGSSRPMESLSLNFTKITYNYALQRPGRPLRFTKGENPTAQTPGLDLNNDSKPEPLLLPAVQKVREAARRSFSSVVAGDTDFDGKPNHTPLGIVDTNGDGQQDRLPTSGRSFRIDLNGDGTPDTRVYTDVNNDGRTDAFFHVDYDGDGLSDALIGFPNRRRR